MEIHTPTWTLTPNQEARPILYPNPTNGNHPVSIHLPNGVERIDGKIELFTLAFRKVLDIPFQVQLGSDPSFQMLDSKGRELANGLYYVVVTTSNDRFILKLLFVR